VSLDRYDVAVIGGGVTGCAIARWLSRYHVRIALLEKEAEVCFGTSKANSGIVHAGFHSTPGTLKARFCFKGNRMYDQLTRELDVEFERNGVLMVAITDEEKTILRKYYQQGLVNGVEDLALLDRNRLLEMEPNLSPEVKLGLYAPGGGVVYPMELTMALAENAACNGVHILTGASVTAIEDTHNEEGAARWCIKTARGKLAAAYIINAAGLYADQIAGMIGDHSFRICPRKGEEYLLDKRLRGLVHSTVFPVPTPVSKGILVIPTIHGNIMLGPTAEEIEERDDCSTTRQGYEQVMAGVRKLVPSISPGDIITAFSGIRAAADQDDFIIGPSVQADSFINVAGIQSPGLTAAPAIAEKVVDILRDVGLRLCERDDFQPRRNPVIRFRELNDEDRSKLIAEDPAYGHVVCRCETVTEAEIIDAIRRGARTLDGIKLRTRAGMGRCQGGFCTPKIINILARELNIDPLQVTKRGAESELLKYRIKEILWRKDDRVAEA